MNSTNPILVGCLEGAIWIRVEGKGSFENSGPIKDLAAQMIAQGHRHFVVDLENCPVMDSTFMGTLTGVALQLAYPEETEDGSDSSECTDDAGLEVINANPRCQQLIQGLGLDHIFQLDEDGSAHQKERKLVSQQMNAQQMHTQIGEHLQPHEGKALDKTEKAEVMLEAHQALTEASDENVPRFRDVIEFLKKDLGRPINRPA